MLPLKDVNPTRRTPIITFLLIAASIAAYVLWQQEPQRDARDDLLFNLEQAAIPCEVVEGRPLHLQELEATYGTEGGDVEACNVGRDDAPRGFPDKNVYLALVTSMFLHGGLMHLAGNMLYLWIFGNNIEDHLGHVRYLLFYLVGGLAASATHVALVPDSTVPVIGASGAVAAVMGAYLVWFPRAPVRTILFLGLPLFVTIQAKWLLGFWFVLQFFTSPNSGVAWAAHVGGFVFGAVIGLLVRSMRPVQRATWTRDHLDDMDPRHWDPTGGVGPVREQHRWTPRR